MRDIFKKNSGITLIALGITIVVLAILSGITISMLNGENGILTNGLSAKEEVEIESEKELLNSAVAQTVRKNKYGILVYEELKERLEKESNNGIDLKKEDEDFLATFLSSKRIYHIDKDGKVEYLKDYK